MTTASPAMAGKVVVVTGAAAGLGLATAEHLGQLGAAVVLVDMNAEGVKAEAARLAADGATVEAQVVDLTNYEQVETLIDGVVERHGRIDGLVNLAALYKQCPLEEMSPEFWHRIITSSLDSTFFTCQVAVRHMRAAGYGRIVNTASAALLMGGIGWGAYCAAKGGVIGFTRVLAREVGPDGITANVIMPGMIKTEHAFATLSQAEIDGTIAMQGVKRLGVPEDIATTIAFLVGDGSSFITGQTINVGGGMNYL